MSENISQAAAVMGRKGGFTRARKLSAKRRREIARMGHRASIGSNPKAKLSRKDLHQNARTIAKRAYRRGQIKHNPCTNCGNPNSIMHHEDYSKPLDVIWLCRSCHLNRHHELDTNFARDWNRPRSSNNAAKLKKPAKINTN